MYFGRKNLKYIFHEPKKEEKNETKAFIFIAGVYDYYFRNQLHDGNLMTLNVMKFLNLLDPGVEYIKNLCKVCGENESLASEKFNSDFDAEIFSKELLKRLLTGEI